MSLRVTFLGTGGAVPTTERAPSALFVNREGDRLLFDCGEGTQRGMMRYGTGFGIDHLFVSHLHGDHVLGIPGLIQTLGFNDRTEPLTIYCPPKTDADLRDLVHAVGHDPAFPVRIEPVAPGEVALDADGYAVRAFETEHRTRSQGYVLEEADRPGRFDRPKAEELGVPVGPKFGRLHAGEPVEAEDGTVVEPDQVVGPPRPGRKLVYTADTRPRERTVEAAGQTQQVVVTNQVVEYGKGVDFGPLDLPITGRVQAAIVTALTTPQVDVLGRTFNPVADMSAADLAAMVQSRYEGLDDVEQVGEETATVAGSPTTVGEFETRAQLVGPGVGVDLTLHISEAVAVGSDLVVGVGGYPSLARRRERGGVGSMFEGIEHQG